MTSQKWKIVGFVAFIVVIYCMVTHIHVPTSGPSVPPILEPPFRFTPGNSSAAIVTCNEGESIFKATKTQIMEPDLRNVSPIFPKTGTNKCIQNVKWKFLEKFSYEEEKGFKQCIQKNRNPEGIFRLSITRLDRTITSAFFTFLKAKPDAVIVEIGGYTGVLLQKLIPITGVKTYAVLEPVPSFYNQLVTTIDKLNLKSVVKTYNFGLGKSYKEISIDTKGDGTSIFKSLPSTKNEKIKIVNVLDFFVQIGVGCNTVDLLTINCEGCEWDVLETLVSTTLIERINHIQFQPHHRVPNIGDYTCRYCRIRQLLARTHMVGYEYPHVWEAWRRKKRIYGLDS